MSRWTDYAENKCVDFMRGQGLTLPAAWHFGLLSAAGDSGVTELTGTDYGRVSVTRSLANFSGTQGAGTTLASTGTSHQSSNNNAIEFPTVGSGGWGNADFLGAFDASSGGNCWWYLPLDSTLSCDASDEPAFEAGSVLFTLGLTGGMSDWLSNKLIDLILRAQAYSWPANQYVGYAITTPNNAAAGTEPAVGGYARVALESSLTALAGTQGAGTTVASTGTGGQTSNNAQLTFPAPTVDQGTATHVQTHDAISAGNFLFWRALAASKSINAGASAPRFAAAGLTFTWQ